MIPVHGYEITVLVRQKTKYRVWATTAEEATGKIENGEGFELETWDVVEEPDWDSLRQVPEEIRASASDYES